jgi:hypothetical protein
MARWKEIGGQIDATDRYPTDYILRGIGDMTPRTDPRRAILLT